MVEEKNGSSDYYSAPKVFDFGENKKPDDFQKVAVTVQPGGDMCVYLNGTLVKMVNPNKGNAPYDTHIDETWATATKNSYFSIGGRYNGAVDRTSTGSLRNVQFYDFAMDAACVTAYNINGKITVDDAADLVKVTDVQEVSFADGEATKSVLNTSMTNEEMLAEMNDAEAVLTLSDENTVSAPVHWITVEKNGDEYVAKGVFNTTKLGIVNTFGNQVVYTLNVVGLKSIGEPVFEGEVLKGELRDSMSETEMLALIQFSRSNSCF